MSLIERFRRWFEYEVDVHDKVVLSLRTVPDDKRNEASYQKAVDLLAHIAAARLLWLYRFGAIDSGPDRAEELFPRGAGLDEVEGRLKAMHATWMDYLRSLDDEALARSFDYRAIEGQRFRNTIEEILTQLFGHSWYHRGQIASIVRSLGGEPAVTDFVYWSRERV